MTGREKTIKYIFCFIFIILSKSAGKLHSPDASNLSFLLLTDLEANPWPCCLRPLAYKDCGFETQWGHGCLSLVSVVCCQVEVSATG
jgi:hypothetical protein